jgi:hypothetical protein
VVVGGDAEPLGCTTAVDVDPGELVGSLGAATHPAPMRRRARIPAARADIA